MTITCDQKSPLGTAMSPCAAELSGVIRNAIDTYAGSLVADSFAEYIVQQMIEWQRATGVCAIDPPSATIQKDIARMLAQLRSGSGAGCLAGNELAQVIADLEATVAELQALLR